MTRGWAVRHRGAAAVFLAVALANCAGVSDDTAATVMGAPGKYDLYSCAQIVENIKVTRARVQELQQLMERSAQGPGGEFVNAVAYRSEYLRNRGDLKVLMDTAGAKNCAGQSKWSSERSVF